MRIALAQQNYHIGNFDANREKIISAIQEAKKQNADLIVFSEMSVCGYPPRDFLEFKDFIEQCNQSINKIAEHTKNIAVIVGAPSINSDMNGKDLFNSAYFLAGGKVKQIINKTLLPTYDIFDEVRYFEANRNFSLVEWNGKKIALTICEDIWNVGNNPLYVTTPMDELKKLNPDFVINISASPFDYAHADERKNVVKEVATKYQLPVFYCNAVGAQTELIFDGGSCVFNEEGELAAQLSFFKEEIKVIEFPNPSLVDVSPTTSNANKIHDALVMGVKDYFQKLNFEKAILGLSGGVDSALVLVLAARALGNENVKAVLLPSQFSSEHSVSDAIALCKNLNIAYEKISIENVFENYLKTLSPSFENKPFDVTEENLQARIRGTMLMALSNKHHYILLNTSNKSEAAVGYGTLYGDMCGGLSVIGDIYKTQVYELCEFINRDGEIIPKNILTKAPSAELRPNQKDSDSLPDYEILDKILFQYIENRKGPKEITAMGVDKNLVERVLRLVNTNEYKRQQTPPVLRVSSKAFGQGRRLPIVGKYLS